MTVLNNVHKDLNKIFDYLTLMRDFNGDSDPVEDELINSIIEIENEIANVDDFILDVLDTVDAISWFLGGTEAIESGKSPGQPIYLLQKRAGEALKELKKKLKRYTETENEVS